MHAVSSLAWQLGGSVVLASAACTKPRKKQKVWPLVIVFSLETFVLRFLGVITSSFLKKSRHFEKPHVFEFLINQTLKKCYLLSTSLLE